RAAGKRNGIGRRDCRSSFDNERFAGRNNGRGAEKVGQRRVGARGAIARQLNRAGGIVEQRCIRGFGITVETERAADYVQDVQLCREMKTPVDVYSALIKNAQRPWRGSINTDEEVAPDRPVRSRAN